jgi:hypothetical protein
MVQYEKIETTDFIILKCNWRRIGTERAMSSRSVKILRMPTTNN